MELRRFTDEARLVGVDSDLFLVEMSSRSSRRRATDSSREVEVIAGGPPSLLAESK
jgi:hypothetical protein